ncbi:hypothetical protein QUC31_012919 [Theobroma cacao]
MADDANSWIRRTKFSHTVCHRLDSSRLVSFPFHLQSDRNLEWSLGLKPRSAVASAKQKSVHNDPQIQRNPITNKQRSVSPLPQTILSDTFKEARSERRRFSTPNPQRKESDKRFRGKFFHKESHDKKGSNSPASSNSSPLRHLGSIKVQDRSKSRKESAWTKYFDHAGGRVNAVEAADEHTVELSQLFLGLRFAHGAHSRLYHGIYKEEPVAVKIIRVPDDDENGNLAARLEKQFNREVTLLSRLHHPNVIKNLRPVIPHNCPPAMRALIEQCWSLHPEKRPDFWQIVKVLEQFESSLNQDGTLKLVQNPSCQDHKKGLLHWIQKLGPVHPHSNAYSSPMPKPKFT